MDQQAQPASETTSPTTTTPPPPAPSAASADSPIGQNSCSGSLAPGGPTNGPTVVMDYNEDFPTMNGGGAAQSNPLTSNAESNAWAKKLNPIRSAVVTQIFHLPAEERKHVDGGFGEKSLEQTQCNEIANKTETKIELSESKDQSLTIVLTGKRKDVEEARKLVVQALQTQAAKELKIPKEHHRWIIGREGKKLMELEHQTHCNINIPTRDRDSEIITIRGPKEGIEKAIHKIQLISDEQSKLAQEHLVIPKIFYPWIRGPNNETLNQIQGDTGARINIPPPSASSDVIVVTGEKEGVHKAANTIRIIHKEKESLVKTVECKVALAQHRYIIGSQRSGLAEILKATGVSVEVPPEEAQSDKIVLRGDPSKLGEALALVYAKATSVITASIECPQWLHKFIIGQRGANLKTIVGDMDKLQVNFEDTGSIYMEGSPEDVKRVDAALSQLVAKLKSEMASQVVKVHPQFHRHVIGKGGSIISKIKQETEVAISIPDESTKSDEIRIEGKIDGVAKASKGILEIVKRLENEKSKDVIIEQRFHKNIIGAKGDNIGKLREKYPGVNISFPEQGRKSDIVTLRGPKDEVDSASKEILKQVKDLSESNFQVHVPIFKDFHKNIIGKGGATIRKIRTDTSTQIDLPSENSEGDQITVTGTKANVEKAVSQLQQIQNELASIVTVEVSIPNKIHSRLIGNGGRLLHDISEQCGGAQIKFPKENSGSDTVVIRGPREEADKAAQLLQGLAKDKELSSHSESVTARPELHRYLIGRGGTKIKKVRESHPEVRIMFPRPDDKDQESIILVGRKEEVQAVRKQLEQLISDLNETEEITTEVDPQHHRHFVARSASVLRDVQDACGGVMISFPKQASGSSTVTIKGSKECVEAAKKRIAEIVDDLENQVSIDVHIPSEYHRSILSNRGAKIQLVTSKYNVQIKFPDRLPGPPGRGQHQQDPAAAEPHENGNDVADSDPSRDIVVVSGRKERCEEAKEHLLSLVPIKKPVPVPYEFHRNIIGKSGAEVRQLMNMYDVNISVPPQDLQKDEIIVTGAAENVENCIQAIQDKVGVYTDTAKDRELRRFQLKINVPAEYHQKIIGPRGSNINKLRDQFGVEISIPNRDPSRNNNNTPELEADEILIMGYEDKAKACQEELEKFIEEFRSMCIQEITLDARIHPRIIGQKGKIIRKIMDDFDVEVRLPRGNDPDPNLVTVSGKSEDAVFDCIDHLRNLEEEYLQDIAESYQPPRREEPKKQVASKSIEVKGAPWNPSNTDQFPSLGGGGEQNGGGGVSNTSSFGAWGRKS